MVVGVTLGLSYLLLSAACLERAGRKLLTEVLRHCHDPETTLYVRRFLLRQLVTHSQSDDTQLVIKCGAFFKVTFHNVLQLYIQCVMHFLLVVATIGIPRAE